MTSPPPRSRVLMLGGGPAGSTAASLRARAEQQDLQEKQVEFFDHVKGLGALDVTVDGLYVMVQPRLRLSHTQAAAS